jgi:plastocyanin
MRGAAAERRNEQKHVRPRLARLALALAAALLVPGTAATAADSGVRGSVVVKERSLLTGLRERSDRSGAVVYLTGFTDQAPAEPAILGQRDERFEPKLLPIVAGQTVRFPNFDRLYHNVFSVSPVKAFDLGQYRSSDPPREVSFESPGLVPVFCNIHPHMISYVVVLENSAFATTDAQGRFEIAGVPAGSYTLNAWIPGAQRVSQELVLAPGAVSEVALELLANEKIAPHKRKDGSNYPRPGTEHYR